MLAVLTDRENQILDLLAEGLTNREISSNLIISEATVENHLQHIFVKLGITRRAQAVAYAFRVKIVMDQEVLANRRILLESG